MIKTIPKYYIVAEDGFFLEKNGEAVTLNKNHRAEFTHYKFAKWHVDNTSIFGKLKIKKIFS